MKQLKRTGIYQASNVWFDPATLTAKSYDWWVFVRKINGKLVFNEYRYSVSTAGHQRKVKQLLRELGIKPDLVVNTRPSLAEFDSLKAARLADKFTAELLAEDAKTKRLERNAKARASQQPLKADRVAGAAK